MAIQSVKRWQWIAISLIVGGGVGYVQQLPSGNWVKSFGDTITQAEFEDGLLKERDGVRWFRNITVLPERIEVDGKSRPIHVVLGDYFDGKLEVRDGQQCAIWRPRCFIAEMHYEPWPPPAGFAKGGTVLAYLDSLKSKGVSYTYAWWRDPKWGMSFWIGGSFLVIGLIWPTIVNLLAFGSFFRPKEPKGTKLRNVVNRPPPPSRPEVTAQDLAALEGMGAALEAELQSQATAVAAPEAEPAAKEEAEMINWAQRAEQQTPRNYIDLSLALRSRADDAAQASHTDTGGITYYQLVQNYGVLPPNPLAEIPAKLGLVIQW